MPVETPVTTPVITPSPTQVPFWEVYTDPERICPAQTKEGASPDVEP